MMPTDCPRSRSGSGGLTQPRAPAVVFGENYLAGADGDRAEALLDHAIAFAQPILRTDPSADLREIIGGRGELISLLQPPLGGQHQPVRDVVLERAMHLTKRNPALGAARRLGARGGGIEPGIDLGEIMPPILGGA